LAALEGWTDLFYQGLGPAESPARPGTYGTKEFGHVSAKEALAPEKCDEMGNGSEEMVLRVRKPAMKLAERLFQ
jgi:hypothetical protein